jgi:hypothetical protein
VNSSSHGAITLQDHEGTLFKVNGQSLKIFLELNEEFEYLDEIDFFCFPTNINFRPQWAVLGFLRISTQLEHLATKIVARRRGGGATGLLTGPSGPCPPPRTASFRPCCL